MSELSFDVEGESEKERERRTAQRKEPAKEISSNF